MRLATTVLMQQHPSLSNSPPLAQVRFQLDELHNPVDVATYQVKETNALVEEFMLFANCTVAKRILEAFPQLAVLRRHPAPSERAFDSLIGAAKLAGFPMRTESSKALAESLDAAHAPGEPYVNQLIRILTTRCMTQAEYFCSGEVAPEQYRHYGLAAPLYTHFTSPIRRYADVMVHRLLAAAIGLAPLPHSYEDRAFMHDTCSNMNRRHLMAQQAGRASVDLYTRIFFRERPVEVDAFVMAVRGKGVEVIVPQFGIEGPVQLNEEVRGAPRATLMHARPQRSHVADVSLPYSARPRGRGRAEPVRGVPGRVRHAPLPQRPHAARVRQGACQGRG